MNQYPEVEKVLTENPLIDEIIYECRQILKGIVIKDEERADNAETKKSMWEADLYKDIQFGMDRFEQYTYTYDVFMKIPSMTRERAILYAQEKLPIPEGLKPELQRLARKKWVDNFQESNEYYRELWGKPPIGDEYIYMTKEEYEMIPVESYDISKPIHECTPSEAALMYSTGVIDHMKERRPDAKYLDHLGDRAIDPYTNRLTPKFGLLYMPPVDSPEVSNKWRERFEINRVYILKTVYSEAYHIHSKYYDRFMMMLIVINTLDDMIVLSPEYIISRDLFDLRTIQYLFEACGVTFFPEIPLKYQKRLIKNLNRLIKYKSCAKCMVDVVTLFGYENMEIFKWYLMRFPNINENGEYRKDTITDPKTGEEVPDYNSNYKLNFLKVPLLGIADDYIADYKQWMDYDQTVRDDIWWNGIYTHEYVKSEILKHEFDIHISKYISIDTVYSLTEMQFQMVYFMNMLLYSKVNTDMLQVEVPEISSSMTYKLVDLIIALFACSYMYQDIVDEIIYDPIQSIAILGFNFETDLDKLADYLDQHGFTIEDVGLDKFINPNPIGIRTWEELEEVYDNNKEVYTRLTKLINNANNKDEYDIYRTVYESLYVTRLNFDMFKKRGINNRAPSTYTEYLKNTNISLYNVIQDCAAIQKDSERRLELTRVINFIVEDIYIYLDQDKFKYVFNGIPTISMDYIRKYIFNILNFFKSYKVDVIEGNVIYKFDDRLLNKVNVIDKLYIAHNHFFGDRISIGECFRMMTDHYWKEDIKLIDVLHKDITYWSERRFYDEIYIRDLVNIFFYSRWHDHIRVLDAVSRMNYTFTWGEHVSPADCCKPLSILEPKDIATPEDRIHMVYHYDPDPIL